MPATVWITTTYPRSCSLTPDLYRELLAGRVNISVRSADDIDKEIRVLTVDDAIFFAKRKTPWGQPMTSTKTSRNGGSYVVLKWG